MANRSTGQNETGFLEGAGIGVGAMGSGGDVLERSAPGASLGGAGDFIGDLGGSIARKSLVVGTGISLYQSGAAALDSQYFDAGFKLFDTGVDLTLSKLGFYGGLAALAYDASGGSKNLANGARLNAMQNSLRSLQMACSLDL